MDKQEHGALLARAVGASRLSRDDIADQTGIGVRTVTNWTRGKTMPTERQKIVLRKLLGNYDSPGDPVERAIDSSRLVKWRREAVKSTYNKHLHEQDAEGVG